MRTLLAAVLFIAPAVAPAGQQRDGAAAPAVGTAVMAGTVVTDETPAAPARRAILTLTDIDRSQSRSTVADDLGRFVFEALPAGRFTLSASKGGYVRTTLGATRPGGAGVTITIAAGRRMTDVTMTLVRGGVITGILRNRRGEPVRNATVYATRPGVRVDRRSGLADANAGASAVTDDRGVYRIFGLRPGEYHVWAQAPFWIDTEPTRLTTPGDLQRARQLIQAARDGSPPPASAARSPAFQGVSYADSFYPGTASIADALPVRVGAGEERAGIDLTLLLISTGRLTGTIVDPGGRPSKDIRAWIRAVADVDRQQFDMRTNADGTFQVPHVMPGEYVIRAQASVGVPDGQPIYSREGAQLPQTHWASLTVTVNGIDQPDLVLRLQPGLKVSGRVVFEGDGVRPDPGDLAVMLFEAGLREFHVIPFARTRADGSFLIEGVAGGRYRFDMTSPAVGGRRLPAGWRVKSIAGGGPDLADVPLEVSADADVSGVTITLTSRTTELAGALQDSSNRPATAYTVVVFSADRAYWTPESRRTQVTRPTDEGRYAVKYLPPGDYIVAALTDVADGQRFDAAFLAPLMESGARVTIVDGQKTEQNLRIVR